MQVILLPDIYQQMLNIILERLKFSIEIEVKSGCFLSDSPPLIIILYGWLEKGIYLKLLIAM